MNRSEIRHELRQINKKITQLNGFVREYESKRDAANTDESRRDEQYMINLTKRDLDMIFPRKNFLLKQMKNYVGKWELLKKTCKKRGWIVGTFATHKTNFYEDACLYLGVGKFSNRNHKNCIWTRDVSYSIGARETGNNKWSRALDEALDFVTKNDPPSIR